MINTNASISNLGQASLSGTLSKSMYIGDPLPLNNWQPSYFPLPTQHYITTRASGPDQTPSQLQKDGTVLIDGHRFKFEAGSWVLVQK